MKKLVLAASALFGCFLINTNAYSQQEWGREKDKAAISAGKANKKEKPGKGGKGAAGPAKPGAAQLAALTKACKDDISKFCEGIEPGLEQGKCLKENESKLSAECGKTLHSLPPPGQKGGHEKGGSDNQQAEAALAKACKDDISEFCKGIEPGMKQGNCLMENESNLSPECGKTLHSLPPPEQKDGSAKGGALNQQAGAALAKACKAEISKFCKDIESGAKQGRCLMENESNLSAGCGKALKSLPGQKGAHEKGGAGNQQAEAALAKGCGAELRKFCEGIEPGLNQGKCLKQNKNSLSAACVKTLKSLPKPNEAALMRACKGDISKFCKDIELGLEQGKCLKENESELSDECGNVLKSMPPPEGGGGPEGEVPGGGKHERGGPGDEDMD